MGAGQSSHDRQNGDRTASIAVEVKQSYYELLGVDKQATDDEIKKSYRRKALELHPDRNYGDTERTTALFAAIQSAYQVLSDPQERAWYDAHEDAILRDIDPTASTADDPAAYERNVGLTTADDITRLLRKFHAGVDFSDAPSGFYGFLRDFFDTLSQEEANAARREGLDAPDYPSFGHQDDEFDDVVKPFYNIWAAFSTRKTFAWRDKYRASDAEDRRMRRLIDKENQRHRKEGIQEFNDAVRTLVAFVRKRDPRYKANEQSEAERQKALRDASAAQAARMRAANAAKLDQAEIPEWTRVRDPGPLDEFEGRLGDEESSEEEHFECVACRKTFKSEKQWEAHEKSKKHIKAIAALRKKLKKEGHDLGLDKDGGDSGDGGDGGDGGDDSPVHNGEPALSEEDVADEPQTSVAAQFPSDDEAEDDVEDLTAKAEALNTQAGPNSDEEEEDETRADTSDEEMHGTRDIKDKDNTLEQASQDESEDERPTGPKMGKAAQKRAKRAAQQAAIEQSDTKFACATCGSPFPSKTRLFQHIQKNGHAAPVAQTAKAGGGGQGGSGKKGKKH